MTPEPPALTLAAAIDPLRAGALSRDARRRRLSATSFER